MIYELWFYLSGAIQQSVMNDVLFILPPILMVIIISYVFFLNAQFENAPMQTIKNAFLIAVANLPTTLLVAALNLVPFILLLVFTEFFIRIGIVFLTIGFATIAYLNTILLRRVFRKYMPENDICEEA